MCQHTYKLCDIGWWRINDYSIVESLKGSGYTVVLLEDNRYVVSPKLPSGETIVLYDGTILKSYYTFLERICDKDYQYARWWIDDVRVADALRRNRKPIDYHSPDWYALDFPIRDGGEMTMYDGTILHRHGQSIQMEYDALPILPSLTADQKVVEKLLLRNRIEREAAIATRNALEKIAYSSQELSHHIDSNANAVLSSAHQLVRTYDTVIAQLSLVREELGRNAAKSRTQNT